MKYILAFAIVSFTASCTTPNISTEVVNFETAIKTVTTKQLPKVEKAANVEFKEAKKALITSEKDVFQTNGKCSLVYQRLENSKPEDCKLISFIKVDIDGVDATEVRDAIYTLQAYSSSIRAIVDSTAPNDISKAALDFTNAVTDLQTLNDSASLKKLAETLNDKKPLIQKTTSFLVNQYRNAQLKKIVKQADIIIPTMIEKMIAYHDITTGNDFKLYEGIINAEIDAKKARKSGSDETYSKALDLFEKKYNNFKKQLKSSPSYQYRLIADAHKKLVRVLNSGGSIQELRKAIDDLNDIAEEI